MLLLSHSAICPLTIATNQPKLNKQPRLETHEGESLEAMYVQQ